MMLSFHQIKVDLPEKPREEETLSVLFVCVVTLLYKVEVLHKLERDETYL
jgi:hypothetical protein